LRIAGKAMSVRVAHHLNLTPAVANPWRGFDDWVNIQPKLPLFEHAVIPTRRYPNMGLFMSR
jgi:hypothetical protein